MVLWHYESRIITKKINYKKSSNLIFNKLSVKKIKLIKKYIIVLRKTVFNKNKTIRIKLKCFSWNLKEIFRIIDQNSKKNKIYSNLFYFLNWNERYIPAIPKAPTVQNYQPLFPCMFLRPHPQLSSPSIQYYSNIIFMHIYFYQYSNLGTPPWRIICIYTLCPNKNCQDEKGILICGKLLLLGLNLDGVYESDKNYFLKYF
jgi:hypothetical protein